ncbi:MAG: hypothetical protein IJA97_03620 [Clostridia bacterium]|nr:hypothetical protein [Clostridia bacterium]
MSIEFNSDLVINYLKKEKISKTKFCKDCKLSISTLNNMLAGKNFGLISLAKISIKMKRNLCEFFIEQEKPCK